MTQTDKVDDAAGAEKGNNPQVPDEVTTGTDKPREVGGRRGPEPTRFGDWEKNGRCIDF